MDSLGKEPVLLHLAEHYQTQIIVTPERLRTLRLLDMPMHHFTTDKTASRFHLVEKKDLGLVGRENKAGRRTIGLKLTGWSKRIMQTGPYHYKIPYSCHSSYLELEQFITSLKFKQLIYTVEASSSFADAIEFYNRYNTTKQPIEEAKIQQPAVQRRPLDKIFGARSPKKPEKRISVPNNDVRIIKRPKIQGNKLR
jgi:hypothetical protein